MLQAAAQVPGVNIFYGPDTYMEETCRLVRHDRAATRRHVHPAHDASTIKALLPRLRYFQDGTCMAHHMFGGDVDAVEKCSRWPDGGDFEVPGEMFKLAMRAKRDRDMGVVGSTKNILDFVVARVSEAVERNLPAGERLTFVLGTETGMVTSIVRAAKARLAEAKAAGVEGVECEIVFPVSTDAPRRRKPAGWRRGRARTLTIVPGPAGGEVLLEGDARLPGIRR